MDENYPGNADFAELPLLIIDDEVDQASADGGGGDPRAINAQIGQFLHPDYFSKKMYIGFTATPYTLCFQKSVIRGRFKNSDLIFIPAITFLLCLNNRIRDIVEGSLCRSNRSQFES